MPKMSVNTRVQKHRDRLRQSGLRLAKSGFSIPATRILSRNAASAA